MMRYALIAFFLFTEICSAATFKYVFSRGIVVSDDSVMITYEFPFPAQNGQAIDPSIGFFNTAKNYWINLKPTTTEDVIKSIEELKLNDEFDSEKIVKEGVRVILKNDGKDAILKVDVDEEVREVEILGESLSLFVDNFRDASKNASVWTYSLLKIDSSFPSAEILGNMPSENARDLLRRELEVIKLLRNYIDAQKKFNILNSKRGYSPSVGPLIKLDFMPDIEDCFDYTNGGKIIYGYQFVEDKWITDKTKELGLFAFPDTHGVDGIHVFWIGENSDIYEMIPYGIPGERASMPQEMVSPLRSTNGWHKISEPWSKPKQVEEN